ncbi:unnamed protein product [Clavelina lepadiformis]|uniref:Membrane-bound transcription factor site-2 protease n=1 Tax=Clavelina lepadiformis TaxID=159417 RepID=A0ABP0GSU9_CLALP
MLPTTFVAVVLAGWACFHLMHNFALTNSWFGPAFGQVIQRNNIFISPFKVSWFTQRWNRYFARIGRCWKLNSWFDAGVLMSMVAMVSSVALLCHNLFSSFRDLPFFTKRPSPETTQVLTVIVPGINLPISDIGYLVVAVMVSGILHEAGHAVAATREGVHVNGFGVFLFILYPGAYVDLNTDDISRASPQKQLRIYCAGVWHNFIICLLACAIILSLPYMLLPFYANYRNGVVVTYQNENSPLYGSKGLHLGDRIVKIGHCDVTSIPSWFQCINRTQNLPQSGSCIEEESIRNLNFFNGTLAKLHSLQENSAASPPLHDCCGENSPPTHLCYRYINGDQENFACLPGRDMMLRVDCHSNHDCNGIKAARDRRDLCVVPHLGDQVSRFIRIVVHRGPGRHHVLYIGQPNDLARFITVSEYVPRIRHLPLRLPAILLRFMQYLFSMSGALALINIVPCYALDGQWAFMAFLDYIYTPRGNTHRKEKICNVVLTSGTILIAANVLLGFIRMASR